jgi:hypothetical protein
MSLPSAFRFDGQGAWTVQDPDEDQDWTFDFMDDSKPKLEVGESIAGTPTVNLTREDGSALGSAAKHNQTNDSSKVVIWIRGLVLGKTYRVECNIVTDHTPPRTYSRSFRIFCRTG